MRFHVPLCGLYTQAIKLSRFSALELDGALEIPKIEPRLNLKFNYGSRPIKRQVHHVFQEKTGNAEKLTNGNRKQMLLAIGIIRQQMVLKRIKSLREGN